MTLQLLIVVEGDGLSCFTILILKWFYVNSFEFGQIMLMKEEVWHLWNEQLLALPDNLFLIKGTEVQFKTFSNLEDEDISQFKKEDQLQNSVATDWMLKVQYQPMLVHTYLIVNKPHSRSCRISDI